jgi:NADH-quinone oxidoreductase subunit J
MATIIQPWVFYALCVLGAVGVLLALPRGGRTPQVLGALVAALAGGLLLVAMAGKAGQKHLPNLYFYVFSLVGLGSALRVITHPRPVYAALYFILTVLASAGLFLILSAEFMAFALIIIYAGAILITYLFVIMLATQAPEEGQEEVLAEYDTTAREPVWATLAGFALLAVLTTMLFRGSDTLPVVAPKNADALLAEMPRKVENVLVGANLLDKQSGEQVRFIDPNAGVIVIEGKEGSRTLARSDWPEHLTVSNVELLGFNLLRDHPGTIEIAGVILLMAMLGAVVLSRKQVQMDEEAKQRQVTSLAKARASHDPVKDSPLELTNPVGSFTADEGAF